MPAASAACQSRSLRNRSAWREAEAQERLQTEDKTWTREQRRATKAQLVAGMQEGHSWQIAAAKVYLQTSQLNGNRL
jgi:hypothetical protein